MKTNLILYCGYPSPSYKCCSKGAIYRDESDPEKGPVVICTYPHKDIFFLSLTQNGFMHLLMPSQIANALNRVGAMFTSLEIPVPAPIKELDQPCYQRDSMRFQDNIALVARVIPDEFISTYGSLHFLPLVTNLFLLRVTLEVFNSLLQQ